MSDISPPTDGAAAVRFDAGHAASLAAALDALARRLERTRLAESTTFEAAAAFWRGPASVAISNRRPELVAKLTRLGVRIDEAADEVRAASVRAEALQLARNADALAVRLQAEARAALAEVRVP